MGVYLRPYLIFSHVAAPSYPSHPLEPVSAKVCFGRSVLISEFYGLEPFG